MIPPLGSGDITKADSDQRGLGSFVPELAATAGVGDSLARARRQARKGENSLKLAREATSRAVTNPTTTGRMIWSNANRSLEHSAHLYGRSANRAKILAGGLGVSAVALDRFRHHSANDKIKKRFVSEDKRADLEQKGHARPGGRFPIEHEGDLRSALHLWGHASESDKAFIRRRASELGATLPDFAKENQEVAKFRLPNDSREAANARDRQKAGLGTAGVGYLVASRGKDVAPGYADLMTRSSKKIGAGTRAVRVENRARRFTTGTQRGGVVGITAGLALAGEGLASDWRHRQVIGRARDRMKERFAKSAFGVEDERLGKAYDPEKMRHERQPLYTGAATGGAVVAGGGAGILGGMGISSARKARKLAAQTRTKQSELGDLLERNAKFSAHHEPTKPGYRPKVGDVNDLKNAAQTSRNQFATGLGMHRTLTTSGADAARMASRARRLGVGAGAAGVAAGALGLTARAVQRQDRKGGRSYGF